MIRFFLYRFFKAFGKPMKTLNESILSRFISNENLLKKILLDKTFHTLWRKRIGNTITNEKYKLKNIKITKINNNYRTLVKIIHSFTLTNCKNIRNSKEVMSFIIIIKKETNKYHIINLYNKECSPSRYDKALCNCDSYIDKENEIKHLEEKIEEIDIILKEFSDFKEAHLRNIEIPSKKKYSIDKAVSYARKHALSYNKHYEDFSNAGGDCTNFVSQCVHAGGLPLSLTWRPYYTAWIRVNELYYYILRKGLGKDLPSIMDSKPGSIIQFFSSTKGFYSHSGIITEIISDEDCLYCCHNFDKLDYPLSEIYPSIYKKIRILNIIY